MADSTSPSAARRTDPTVEALPAGDHSESHDERDATNSDSKIDGKDGKRRLFGLLKKKTSGQSASKEDMSAARSTPPTLSPQRTPPLTASRFPVSPQSNAAAISPQRQLRSPSPGLHSPASSLIFERNVQEQPLPDDLSSAIPHHIQTEDHIPAVLEASSLAITDNHLNPDEVEIVMHAAHQPASMAVAGEHPENTSGALSPISSHEVGSQILGSGPVQDTDEATTTAGYGTLDNADIRRLSFISFADVIQSEHVEASNKAESTANLQNHMSHSFSTTNRSPSPMRSPASSHGFATGTSPPTSGAPSIHGLDIARGPGSPMILGTGAQSPALISQPLAGELKVETMRQAVRKTASGDLSGARSPNQALSAVSLEDTTAFGDASPFGK